MDDESGVSMEPMEEVPLIELGEAELETYDLYYCVEWGVKLYSNQPNLQSFIKSPVYYKIQ